MTQAIAMHPVVSSSILLIGYDVPARTLYISFTSHRTYAYADVPIEMYRALMAAPSVGKFFSQFIKDKYKTTEMETQPQLESAPTPFMDTTAANTVKIVGGPLEQGSSQAAGYDLRSIEDCEIAPGTRRLVETGVKVQMPDRMCALVTPRSGLALKKGITVLNSPGLIDPDYRGPVNVIVQNHGHQPFSIAKGDRIAQLLFVQFNRPHFVQVDELDADSERGEKGYGSSGVK